MLTEIQIANFRGIKSTKTLPLAPLTVFTGKEGSGKSSVGHFLTMLKQTVTTADNSVVLYPGDKDSPVQLGTQSSLLYQKADGGLSFSYRFNLPTYLLMEDPEKDKFSVPTQFIFGENIKFSCHLSNENSKHPFVERYSYELYDKDNKVASASSKRTVVKSKKSESIQYLVETEGYELKNRTGRPWLQQPPKHFYGFSDELNTYYKNADAIFDMSHAHEQLLRNIYYVGSDRTRFNALHLWSGLHRFDVGHNGAHTITALLGAQDREISLGERRRNQPVMEIIDTLLQQMELLHGFHVETIDAIEHGYSVRVTARTSKNNVELTEAGKAIAQVLPMLVQCFCAPHNSIIVLDGIETHLSTQAQALLADVLLTVIQSKEDGLERNIQLIVSTQSEAFVRRLQRRIAEGEIPASMIAAYKTSNHRRGIDIDHIPLLTKENTLSDLSAYFTFEDDDRTLDITVSNDLPIVAERELEKPVKPAPKKLAKKSTRGPGRPKGSKNKPKTDDNKPKRGPGRPKGSKNKPKTDTDKPKRGPGRPKGSKNKKTTERKGAQATKENRRASRIKARHADKNDTKN